VAWAARPPSPTRESADVAINYYPDEEPDSQEVIRRHRVCRMTSLQISLKGDRRWNRLAELRWIH
jgi:hypothetical protein